MGLHLREWPGGVGRICYVLVMDHDVGLVHVPVATHFDLTLLVGHSKARPLFWTNSAGSQSALQSRGLERVVIVPGLLRLPKSQIKRLLISKLPSKAII